MKYEGMCGDELCESMQITVRKCNSAGMKQCSGHGPRGGPRNEGLDSCRDE